MTNQSSFPDYNSDGSMNPHVRDRFLAKGFSEQEIKEIEEVSMRDARVDQEMAEYRKQYEKEQREWREKRKAEKREKEKLGIKPTFKILYSSPDKIDVNSMNPSERRAFEMSGLSTEELLSQGYIDPDQLPQFRNKLEDNDPPPYKADPNTPDIPF